MDITKFKDLYTPTMMRLIKGLSEKLKQEISEDLSCDNNHVLLKAKDKIDDLAQCTMLLAIYHAFPINGCKFCFTPDCESDHK